MLWKVWLVPLVAYLIGSFPTGVVLSRRRYGFDVRDMGSGNIGATNITRNFGWKAGIVTFLIDFMKGYLGLKLAEAYCFEWPWIITATGLAVVLGHCYSVFLRFRGGKGVATTLGCFAAAVPPAALGMAGAYVVFLFFTRISAIGSLVGVVLASLYVSFFPPPLPAQWLVWGLTAVVFVRHQSNLRRLFSR